MILRKYISGRVDLICTTDWSAPQSRLLRRGGSQVVKSGMNFCASRGFAVWRVFCGGLGLWRSRHDGVIQGPCAAGLHVPARHIANSIANYVVNPKAFRARV